MKRTRKGFTLIELLIVIAIMATLTAAMTMSIKGATASAKASTIAANLETLHSVTTMVYAISMDEKLSEKTATDVMNVGLRNSKTWDKISGANTDAIYYTLAEDTGPDNWAVTVNYANDNDKDDITKVLKKMKGYGDIADDATTVTMKLLKGTIDTDSGSGSGGGEG